MNTTYFCCWAL